MSRLSNLIKAHQIDVTKPVTGDITTIVDSFGDKTMSQSLTTVSEYRLGVKFEVKGFANSPEELVNITDMARRQILNEVFGEFTPLLHSLERHLYNRDFYAARAALQRVINEMQF